MKRIMKIAIATVVLLILIPAVFMTGQEKKNQQKIKVVVTDKDGEKVVIDTTLNNIIHSDTVKLKDGMVLYLGDKKGVTTSVTGVKGDGKMVMVSVNEDDKGDIHVEKNIMIDTDDSITVIKKDGENIIVMKGGKYITKGDGDNVLAWVSEDKDSAGRYIYINKDLANLKEGERKFNIEINSDESGDRTDKINYVIAKDGITISIEGSNEEKVKELADIIESAMDRKNEDSSKQATTKEKIKKNNKN
jgi:hypothetical protein